MEPTTAGPNYKKVALFGGLGLAVLIAIILIFANHSAGPDKQFMERETANFQQAVAVAATATTQNSQTPDVLNAAASMRVVMPSEINQMKDWDKKWYGANLPRNAGSIKVVKANAEALNGSSSFDNDFVAAILPYLKDSLSIAKQFQPTLQHSETKDLAASIIRDVSAQISTLQKIKTSQ